LPALALTSAVTDLATPQDEIHYVQKPMRRQFRVPTERQSDSSRVLAEGSPGCKHERCRSGSNAVTVIAASGSDDLGKRGGGLRGAGRSVLQVVRCDYADIGITGVMPRGLLCRVGADDRLFSLEIAI